MTKRLALTLSISLFYAFFSDLRSQENSEEVSLTSVLKEIEITFNVSFSYADDVVSSLKLPTSFSYDNLDNALLKIENSTGLSFDILDSRFIVIKDIGLINKVQELDNIYISNLLTSGISKSSSGVTLIKPERFGILPGIIEPDVLQTVQALPGILSTEETVSDLNIRGGTNDQNLILWDGIKMYQSGHFFGLISAFNPYLTKRVEVIKNGTSARYGDGVSGTIRIGLDDEVSTTSSSSLSANLLHFKGFTKLPISKKMTLLLSARRSNTDFIQTPTYDSYTRRIFQDTDLGLNSGNASTSTNLNFYFYDVSTKLIYDISSKDRLRLSATTLFNKLEYDEATILDGITSRSGINQGNNGLKLSYSRNWNEAFNTELEIYASNYELNARNFNVENDQLLDQENEVLDLGLKLQTSYKINDYFLWNNGYQFFEIGTRNLAQTNIPSFFSNEKKVIRTHAVYSEVALISKDNATQFTAGARGNYIEAFNKLIIEPRLRFSQRFWNYFKISALGEFKNQSIFQIIEQPNDFLGLERRRWVSSNNENLPIIKSKQASLSLDYTKNKWLLAAEGYLKNVDGITSRSQSFQNQFQFENATGSYDVVGIDLLASKRFKKFASWLSYSYTKNYYTFETLNEGRTFPNNTDVRHSLNFGSSYTIDNFKVSLGFNWRTGTPITLPRVENSIENNQIVYDSPNSILSDSFLRFDVSAVYKFKVLSQDLQIGASIWNLLNNENVLNTYFFINDENEIQKTTIKSLRFTPNVSIQYSF